MNRRRYYKRGLCTGIVLLILTGCSPQQDQATHQDLGWEQKITYSMKSDCSEEGYYYYRNQQFLNYFDFSSQQNVSLCGKVGCHHQDESCDAFCADPVYLYYDSESLYTVERNNNAYELTKRNKDGSNYETMGNLTESKLPEGGGGIELTDFMAAGSRLYFLGQTLDIAWKQDSNNQTCLYSVDLNNGEETLLYEVPMDKTCALQAVNSERVIFYEMDRNSSPLSDDAEGYEQRSFLESQHIQVKLLDVHNLSVKLLVEDDRYRMLGPAGVNQNLLYLVMWDENHERNRLECLNMDTGERKEVLPPSDIYMNYIALDSGELMLLTDGKWHRYPLEDFQEKQTDFLPPTGMISESGTDGYIVDYFTEDSGQRTYSYITRADAESGQQKLVDFYIVE